MDLLIGTTSKKGGSKLSINNEPVKSGILILQQGDGVKIIRIGHPANVIDTLLQGIWSDHSLLATSVVAVTEAIAEKRGRHEPL